MPVRHRDEEYGELTPPEPKRCKYCDECGVSCGANGGEPGWRVTLDHDLVETLSAIYPEWFKPQRSGSPSPHSSQTSDDTSCESGDMSSVPPQPPSPPRDSPPKVVVDASPLQPAMDKNKESLKVKLMMRRPITTLVDQGIMPPLKTPPAYYEQRKQLERAKTGDLLKAKIQRRPDRQELERRHILESQEGHLDPSLAEKQRMLKKARLADQLNDQLSHRPGPLELIKKNILHTEEPIEIAVKQGLLNFKATCEGLIGRPEHPSSYCGPPDESPAHSPPSVCSVPSPPSTSTSTLSPESIASPQPHSVSGKDKIRKKLKHKPKEQPKQRPIKFHVYTGPPNAPKQSSPPHNTLESAETSYQLLLQQQKMFLEFMLSGTPKSQSPSPPRCDPPPPPPLPPQANTPPTRFEEMKVSDLRSELKRRNLPVSGPKPILVERLRVHLGEIDDVKSPASVVSHDSRSESMERELNCQQTQMTQHLSDDIVAEQRRQIEDLQRKLEASRRQIEEMRREATSATTQIGNSSDQPKKILQAKIKESQIRAQLEALQGPTQTITVNHSQLQHQTPRNIAAIPQTITAIPQSITTTPQAITTAIKPSYVMYTMDGGLFAVRQAISEPQSVNSDSGNTPTATKIIINGMEVPIMFVQQASAPQPAHASPPAPPPPPPPPQQEQPSMEESHIMDDVLQILVENGELPATVIGNDDDCTDFLMSDFLGGRDEGENERLRRELDDIQNELLRQVDLHGVGNDDADVVDLNYNWERGLLADEPMDVCPALGDEPMDATSPAPLLDPDILYAPPTGRDPLLAGRLSCAAPAPPVKHYSWDKFEFDTT